MFKCLGFVFFQDFVMINQNFIWIIISATCNKAIIIVNDA